MSVERMDVAIMRTTKPRAIPTILRLIDWLNMALGTGSWKGRSEFDVVRPDQSHYNVLAQPRPDPIALRRISNTKQRRRSLPPVEKIRCISTHRCAVEFPQERGTGKSGRRGCHLSATNVPQAGHRTIISQITRPKAGARNFRGPLRPHRARGFLAAPRSRQTHFPCVPGHVFRSMSRSCWKDHWRHLHASTAERGNRSADRFR